MYAYRDYVPYSDFFFIAEKQLRNGSGWASRKDFWLESEQTGEIAFAPWRTPSSAARLQFKYFED